MPECFTPPPTAGALGDCNCRKFAFRWVGQGKSLAHPDFSINLLLSRRLIAGIVFVILLGAPRANCGPPSGFLEGHLKIISPMYAERDDANVPRATVKTYAEYPLVVLSQDGQREIARVIADANGNYRAVLPPGAYILDMQDRARKRVHAKPQPFTIKSNETIHLDMNVLIARGGQRSE